MTIPDRDETRPSSPPRRSGEPWSDDDYQTLLRGCREGLGLTMLSQRLQRGPQPVRERAKRLLPLDQRGVPGDRVLTQLRQNLLKDPDYDWAHHLAATPPPRPIVNHVLPQPRYAGIPGLEDHELLATAQAVAQQGGASEPQDHLAHALAREVSRRNLDDALQDAAATHARQRAGQFLQGARSTYGKGWYHDGDDWYSGDEDW